MRMSRRKVEELMLVTMNPEITVLFLSHKISKEFIAKCNYSNHIQEELISIQHDREDILLKFGLVIPKLK